MAWDAICVGGGLGGAGIAFALAKCGARVLVLERETKFRDRVRGEYLESWGVAEVQALGLEGALSEAGAYPSARLDGYVGGLRVMRRDFDDPNAPVFPAPRCVGHPAFQEAVLAAAGAAGAEVRRGVTASEVTPGRPPSVRFRGPGGSVATESARLVVGADGRDSKLRCALGFHERRDSHRLCLAGLLLEGYAGPLESSAAFWNFPVNEQALLFPREAGVLRGYMSYRSDTGVTRFSGKERIPDFLAAFRAAGVPAEWLAGVRVAGPLAGFEGADSSVAHPVREGVALVGDAAACSDPVWGCGMSLTLRDVRTLRDALAASTDWDAALHAYAEEHDRYYERLHTLEDWMTRIFFEPGADAEALRGRVFAKAAADPTRVIDIVGLGPDQPVDESARRFFFAED